MFFYEHMGHMQFSTLTLHALKAIESLSEGKVDVFVPWATVRGYLEKQGFSVNQADGELERFCYGFECIDHYDRSGTHLIALTGLGRSYIDHILAAGSYQRSLLAFIMRRARKRNCWNVIVQESTFFNQEVYELLRQYNFRPGPARDFLRCISTTDVVSFITSVVELLSPAGVECKAASLCDCIRLVEREGKYWASVGGKYSWFVFGQKYNLPLNADDWQRYRILVKSLIRPPEWGGGREIAYSDLCDVLGGSDAVLTFRNAGIVRPRWTNGDITSARFCLTAPGYLMWERNTKGFCYEFLIKRESTEVFSLGLCRATDFPTGSPGGDSGYVSTDGIPSSVWKGRKGDLVEQMCSTLTNERRLKLK